MDQWYFVISDDENASQPSVRGSSSGVNYDSDTSSSGSSGSSSEASSSSKDTVEAATGRQTLSREVIRLPELIDEDLSILPDIPAASYQRRSLANVSGGADRVSAAYNALATLEREEWLLDPPTDELDETFNVEGVMGRHERLLVGEPPTLVKRPVRSSEAARYEGIPKTVKVGATRCSIESLAQLRRHFLVPNSVEFLLPSLSDRASCPPEGYFTLYKAFFYDTYLWFPIPSVVFKFLNLYSIAISQLMPRGMRHLMGLIIRSYEEGVELTAKHIDALVYFSTKNDYYFLSTRAHRQVINDFPNKDTDWWKWFFYVRKDEASVCSEALHLVRPDHSPIVRPTRVQVPEDIVEFATRLRSEKTSWIKSFHLVRIRRELRRVQGFVLPSSSSDNVSPNTEHLEMVRGLSLREKRLVEEQKKAGEGSSAQVLAQKKGKGKVTGSPATTPRPTPVSRPPSSSQRPRGSNPKRKADSQDAGKKAEAPSHKKAKVSTPAPGQKRAPTVITASEDAEASGSPTEWFSRLVCAGEPMLKSSELRRSSEYNDIVRLNCRVSFLIRSCLSGFFSFLFKDVFVYQMVAQINKLTARYEGDIVQAEGEACRVRSELEEEKSVYEASERSLHEQMNSIKDECKLLVGSKDAELARKDSKIKVLKRKLRDFEKSKELMEAEVERECWGRINSFLAERCRNVMDCVEQLRGDVTMDFVNYCQAKNNLEFIEEARRNDDFEVSDETEKLKEEMVRYADSEANFDQVLDEIESELKSLPVSFEREKMPPLGSNETLEPETAAAEEEAVNAPIPESMEVRPETERLPVEVEQPQVEVGQPQVEVEQTRIPVESGAEVSEANVAEMPAVVEQGEVPERGVDGANGEV